MKIKKHAHIGWAPAARPLSLLHPWLMGERHSAAGMCVSDYIKSIFTSTRMEVGVAVAAIVRRDFWLVTLEICFDSL